MLPLKGTTIVALEQAVAAPFATRQLAELGARVVKVERPGAGDFARAYDTTVRGASSHFVWVNRSKESLTLDLKHPEALEILDRLLARADVFVQNLAPGAVDRMGLGARHLREKYPRLIVCGISGYGTCGPYRDKKAYDLLIQSEAGVVSITGTEQTPSKVGVAIADIAGGMYAYAAVLTALLMRTATGQGTIIEVSLFEALAEWMGYPLYYTAYGGTSPPRSGASHAAIAPYGPFSGGDGKPVFLGIQNEREWVNYCEQVLRLPELLADARFGSNSERVQHRPELHAIIERVFQELTSAEIVERLDAAQIANARLNTVQDLLSHPQLAARRRWAEVDSPVGPLRALVPAADIDGVEVDMRPIPRVGEHTVCILKELGLDDGEIEALSARHVV